MGKILISVRPSSSKQKAASPAQPTTKEGPSKGELKKMEKKAKKVEATEKAIVAASEATKAKKVKIMTNNWRN